MTDPVSHGAGLLERWLQNPLDEGYTSAAERKAAHAEASRHELPAARRRFDVALTAVGCVLIGMLLVTAYLQANREAPRDARARADLRAQIAAAQSNGTALERSAQSLENQVAARRAAALGTGSTSALARTAAQAGTTAVRGPGVRVVLGNPPAPTTAATTGRAGTTPIGEIDPLTDLDVRAVVNELWLDGAEAIGINGIRLTPTSAIRFAGQVVLVDFQPVTAPYSIDAIGDSDTLITAFTDSPVADRYRTLASADRYRFSTDQLDTISLPASVLAQPQYASIPPAGATPTPPRSQTPAPTPTPTPTPSGQRS